MDAARLAANARAGEADLVEVFSSIQGEGPRVGERHLFVRFAHCDMHCRYCDTPLCHVTPSVARVEVQAGRRRFEALANPVALETLGARVDALLAEVRHHAVSFTGGEPLLHPGAIAALAPLARARGVRTLLETDANLPEAFDTVAEHIDVLSLDWKLESATGEPTRVAEHRRFLTRGRTKETYVKVVFVAETPVAEVLAAARAVAEIAPATPFILQPCTPFGPVRTAPSPAFTLELAELAGAILPDVRVIPQVHRLLKQP